MELLVRDFQKRFHASPQVVTRAPGRLEILGNHTDYNEGVTLSCAVNLATYVAIRKNGSMMMRLADVKLPNELHEIPLDPLPPPTPGDWTNYIRGVVQALQKRNYRLEGFDLLLVSELPLSSGMSSSAALEIATAYAIGDLFRIQLPPKEWAKIGQEAENLYVGAKTGLLDQFSSIFGKENSLVFCDFRSLEVETCPVPIGTKLIIAHSGVKHNLTMEYNERRSRCEEAARTIGVRALRDVSLEILNQWKNRLHPVTYRRALHVVGENERVFQAMEVLKKNDLQAFGLLLLASHQSSRENFENSCPELDQLVEIGKTLPGFIGARLSGGGFGGITVHFVQEEMAELYTQRLKTAFGALTSQTNPMVISCNIGEGAAVLCSNH